MRVDSRNPMAHVLKTDEREHTCREGHVKTGRDCNAEAASSPQKPGERCGASRPSRPSEGTLPTPASWTPVLQSETQYISLV